MKKLKFIVFLFLLIISPVVYADSFNSVTIAYGYDRGEETDIWSGYSSTLSHNFGTTDPTIGYINTLNVQLALNNSFQIDRFYTITFNFQNDYTEYSSNFTLYQALQEMGYFNLRCSTSSSGGTFLPPESCFNTNSFRFERTSNNSVKGIISISPSINFQRLLINITRDGTPTGQQLVSNAFSFSNFSFSVATGGTGEIINNQNQNTQDIINNQTETGQEIINNQNQNTQDIINSLDENFNGCFNYNTSYSKSRNPYNDNVGYFSTNGEIINSPLFRYTYYLIVTQDKTYFINRTNNNIVQSYCLYDSNQILISCHQMGSSQNFNFVPDVDGYVRISYSISSDDTLEFTGQYCTSKFNQLNEDFLSGLQGVIDNQNQTAQEIIDSTQVCFAPAYLTTYSRRYIYAEGGDNPDMVIGEATGTQLLVYDVSNFDEVSFKFVNYNRLRIGVSDELTNEVRTHLTLVSRLDSPVPGNSYSFSTYGKKYMYMFLSNDTSVPGQVIFDKTYCKGGNEVIYDSITDSSVDSDVGSDFFDDFNSNDFGLSQIITIPLSTIQSLTSKTCVPLQVPIPFTNSNVSLPCMTQVYESKLPIIYNLWKIVSFGIIAYLISIDIFHLVKGFKDPESDKVEVLDL